MRVGLPPAASRLAAVALLAALLGAAYALVVAPLVERYDTAQHSIVELRDTLRRYQLAGEGLAAEQARLVSLEKRTPSAEGFLQGANDTLLALQIQGHVKVLARSTGGTIETSEVLPPEPDGKVRRIGVRTQMSTTVAGALRLFYGIEAATPILFVDNLDMRTRERRRFGRAASGNIEVVFEVYGYAEGAQ